MPTFKVTNTDTGSVSLVQAKKAASAINHVVNGKYTAEVVEVAEAIELNNKGVELEVAAEKTRGKKAEDQNQEEGQE